MNVTNGKNQMETIVKTDRIYYVNRMLCSKLINFLVMHLEFLIHGWHQRVNEMGLYFSTIC